MEDPILQGQETETIPPDPLFYAIEMGLKDVAIFLIAEQNANEISILGGSPLGIVCTKGLIEIIDLMFENKVDITAAGNDGWTTVIAASSNGYVGIFELFSGIPHTDARKPDNLGRTALFFASWYGQYRVAQVLLSERDIDLDTKD